MNIKKGSILRVSGMKFIIQSCETITLSDLGFGPVYEVIAIRAKNAKTGKVERIEIEDPIHENEY